MTEFEDGTLITMEAMGYQVHAIGKAIRPLFTDPVTYVPDKSILSLTKAYFSMKSISMCTYQPDSTVLMCYILE